MKPLSNLLIASLWLAVLISGIGCDKQPYYPAPDGELERRSEEIRSFFMSVEPAEGEDGLRRFEAFMDEYRELHENDERTEAYLLYYFGYLNGLLQHYPQTLELYLASYELAKAHQLRALIIELTQKMVYANNMLAAGLNIGEMVAYAVELANSPPSDPFLHHLALHAKGSMYYYQQNYTAAIEVLLPAAAFFREREIRQKQLEVNNILALSFQRVDRYNDALEYLRRNQELHQISDNPMAISQTRGNIAIVHARTGNFSAAIDSTKVSLAFNDSLGRRVVAIQNIYNIATFYRDSGNPDEAIAYFREGLDRSLTIGLKQGVMFNGLGLARLLLQSGSKDLAEIRTLLDMTYHSAANFEQSDLYEDYAYAMFRLELKSGNMDEAFSWNEVYLNVLETKYSLERQAAIDEILVENRLLSSQAEIQHLNETISLKEEAQRNLYAGLFILIIMLAGAAGATWHFSRLSRKINRAHATLKSQNQEIINQNARLVQLSEERQRLIKIIIHDLRNPISSLNGSLELLREDRLSFLESFLEIATLSVSRMGTIVNGLLELFKTESMDVCNELEKTAVNDFLKEILKEFETQAAQKQQEIVAELPHLEAVTHQKSLQTIAGNLVSNAIKYAPAGTQIKVSVQTVENGWQLKVRDQGPGFREADMKKMFTLFGRLSGKPTGNEESTGIGLYAVKTTIEKLGGSITLNWDYEEGAEFICWFPYLRPGYFQ
ncbi:MAG: hypothetical protein LAT75_11595 [Candidatus Cyclonatronum sp.]|uniref:ATP-binding protein n=1 Tax=Cyclonatronum sp. TaxID=3024185 RepID=UPI0025C273C4|nr:ATP-binding protein [Cyclonatronum sp.]MCH8487501.1 hypothetical protein [Cyclonatronum sp.]